MPTAFPDVNLGGFFSNVWAPGALSFRPALQYWQNQMRQGADQQGGLAASAASDPVAQAYQDAPYSGPAGAGGANAGGYGAFSQLLQGKRGSRAQGRAATSDARTGAIKGALGTSEAFGNSAQDMLGGQIALRNAQESQTNSLVNNLGGLFTNLFGPGFLRTLFAQNGGGMSSIPSTDPSQIDSQLALTGANYGYTPYGP